MDDKIRWSVYAKAVCVKDQKRVYILLRLRSFDVSEVILCSVSRYGTAMWYANLPVQTKVMGSTHCAPVPLCPCPIMPPSHYIPIIHPFLSHCAPVPLYVRVRFRVRDGDGGKGNETGGQWENGAVGWGKNGTRAQWDGGTMGWGRSGIWEQ